MVIVSYVVVYSNVFVIKKHVGYFYNVLYWKNPPPPAKNNLPQRSSWAVHWGGGALIKKESPKLLYVAATMGRQPGGNVWQNISVTFIISKNPRCTKFGCLDGTQMLAEGIMINLRVLTWATNTVRQRPHHQHSRKWSNTMQNDSDGFFPCPSLVLLREKKKATLLIIYVRYLFHEYRCTNVLPT